MDNSEKIKELDKIVKQYKETLNQYFQSVQMPEDTERAVIDCIQSIGAYENVRERQ